MRKKELVLVSFKPSNGEFTAYIPMYQFLSSNGDLEPALKEAAQLYEHSMVKMRAIVAEIDSYRINRILLPARKVWQLGNLIFELVAALERLSFQLDGIYDHLVRDLHAKRKWLEKVIIFRRYIPCQSAIPDSLNWGRCEKGTRKVAEKLWNDASLN